MSSVLNLTEAKAKFSEVVDRVSHGEEIIVTRMGHPVARITRYEPATASRRLGFFQGWIRLDEAFDDWPADIARDLDITDRSCAFWLTRMTYSGRSASQAPRHRRRGMSSPTRPTSSWSAARRFGNAPSRHRSASSTYQMTSSIRFPRRGTR